MLEALFSSPATRYMRYFVSYSLKIRIQFPVSDLSKRVIRARHEAAKVEVMETVSLLAAKVSCTADFPR